MFKKQLPKECNERKNGLKEFKSKNQVKKYCELMKKRIDGFGIFKEAKSFEREEDKSCSEQLIKHKKTKKGKK